MAKKDKRILVLADTHCGSAVGLTPPVYWIADTEKNAATRKLEEEMWTEYRRLLRMVGPVDILFFLGDGIDGKQKKEGSRGLLTADLHEQGEMNIACIAQVDAKKKVYVGGTPYHTGEEEDEEIRIAEKLDAIYDLRKFVTVNGLTFDLRHFIPGSSIPHGRYTALAKDVLWNDLWTIANMQPKADVTLRAHVHYYADLGSKNPDHRAIIVPGLQAVGGLFGSRKLSTKIDWGITWIDVTPKGNFTWDSEVVPLLGATVQPEAL